MPAPIQPVTSFAEAELWYMYQQLTEINTNTSGGGGGLSQTEVFEIFNGTNPQGFASSLFETISGADTSLANLLVETLSGNNFSIANLVETCSLKLSSINTNTGNTATNCGAINTNTLNTTTAIGLTNTYLSTVRTPVIISTSASATISGQLHNISIYNSGSATGTVTVGATTVNLPAGVTVNYDAGGNNNRFATNTFGYDATGTTFLISYVS
jgi:hypothetical protein